MQFFLDHGRLLAQKQFRIERESPAAGKFMLTNTLAIARSGSRSAKLFCTIATLDVAVRISSVSRQKAKQSQPWPKNPA
jgi:hypothetical protein